jgi:rhamnulokinase
VERYLAFDLGAESGRAILGSLDDNDNLSISEIYRFPNKMVSICGHYHWDSSKLINEIYEGLKICKEKYGTPICIGVDTWGVDYALLKKGSITGLPYTYRDHRTEGAAESFSKQMPLNRLYSLTGIQILPFNTVFQLYAARKSGQKLGSGFELLMMADLINYILAGVKKSEFTIATTTQIFNPNRRGWEPEILEILGASNSLMQEITQPGTIIGELIPAVKAKTGLENVDVAAVASHDTGSAVAATPGVGEDFAYISSGTWSLMGVESRAPLITEKTRQYNITNEGGVSGTYRVLKNISGLWLLQECRKTWIRDHQFSYDELTRLAEKSEPLRSLINPDWAGFLNPTSMPKAISDYCRKTGQPAPRTTGEYVRTIIESLALAYKYTLSQLEEVIGKHIDKIHVVGGGSRNELLCQLTAEVTNRSVHAGPFEATAVGNILVQAIAKGRVKDLLDLRRIVRKSFDIKIYEPNGNINWKDAYNTFLSIREMKVK